MKNFDLKKYLAEGKLYENDGNIKFINKFNPSQKIIDMYNENPHLKKPLSSLSKYKKIQAIDQLRTHFSPSQAKRDMIKKEDRFDSSLPDIIEAWADDYYKDSDFFSYGKYVDKDYFDFFNANKDLLLKKYKKQQIPSTLAEGIIKENITKLDNYALEIYSDFRKDPSIHFPDVEFEVDEEGFALENDSNYSQLKKYKREIMGLHALFGEESGVKDKNGLQLSMYDVIDNI